MALAAFAGLRVGEAAALQIHDIDFLRREIHVRRQVQRANGGEVEIRAPKYSSERTVPAADGLLNHVAEHIRLWLPEVDAPKAWLFPGENGHHMHQNSVGYRWRKAKRRSCSPTGICTTFDTSLLPVSSTQDATWSLFKRRLDTVRQTSPCLRTPTSGRMQMTGRVRPQSRCSTSPFSRLPQAQRNRLAADREIYCGP